MESCILVLILFYKRLDTVVVLAKPKSVPEKAHSYTRLLACNTTHLSGAMVYISIYVCVCLS